MISSSKTRLIQRALTGWILLITLLTAVGVSKWSADGIAGVASENALLESADDAPDFEPDPDVLFLSGSTLAALDVRRYGEIDEPSVLVAPESGALRTTRERSPPTA